MTKTKGILAKVVNGSEDVLSEVEYNFGLIDPKNPGN